MEIDLRPGGSYKWEIVSPTGAISTLTSTILEVVAPEYLVLSNIWPCGPEMFNTVVTIEFLEADDKTRVVLSQETFTEDEALTRHREGWLLLFDELNSTF